MRPDTVSVTGGKGTMRPVKGITDAVAFSNSNADKRSSGVQTNEQSWYEASPIGICSRRRRRARYTVGRLQRAAVCARWL